MKKKYIIGLCGVIAISAVMIFALTHIYSVRSGPQASTPTPSGWPNYPQFNPNGTNVLPEMPSVVPPKLIDLSPNDSSLEKASVIVQLADGSREMFLLGPELNVDTFIKHLPVGDKLINVLPSPLIMMSPQAPTIAPSP
jgi:hypothetical protein